MPQNCIYLQCSEELFEKNSSIAEYEIIENLKTDHKNIQNIITMHNTTNQMSRRHFLATTGAIAGTALLNPLSDIKAKTIGISAPTGKNSGSHLSGQGAAGHPCGEGTF